MVRRFEKSQKSGMVQRKKCRSRQELSDEYLVSIIYLQHLASIQPLTSWSDFLTFHIFSPFLEDGPFKGAGEIVKRFTLRPLEAAQLKKEKRFPSSTVDFTLDSTLLEGGREKKEKN